MSQQADDYLAIRHGLDTDVRTVKRPILLEVVEALLVEHQLLSDEIQRLRGIVRAQRETHLLAAEAHAEKSQNPS